VVLKLIRRLPPPAGWPGARLEEDDLDAGRLVDQFDEMLAQSRRQPLVCPISLHPFAAGRPYRVRQLRRAFQHILSHRDRVWITRPRDICAHVEALPAGVVPGS
jgi:allantoinase